MSNNETDSAIVIKAPREPESNTRFTNAGIASNVKYPFLPTHPQYEVAKRQMKLGGAIVAFEIKGGIAAGRSFLDNIKMCSLSANLGDTRTIVTHPSSTTHGRLSEEDRLEVGITDGLVRISVGLENVEDIIADIQQALGVWLLYLKV